jgi:hypothetical protein
MSTEWSTIADLATASGTLVLAVATFSSVRSANRSARVAERSLLVGLRPLLMPSRFEDPPEKVSFGDGHWARVEGGHAAVEVTDDVVYLTVGLRNAGNGIAVLHGWSFAPRRLTADDPHTDPADFVRQSRDIYVPANSSGFWQAALRDPAAPEFGAAVKAIDAQELLTVEVLYGDHEGGQRMISRFTLSHVNDGVWLAAVSRHWDIDRAGPRD